jgi:hypothetical protein
VSRYIHIQKKLSHLFWGRGNKTLRVCLVACITADFVSYLIQAHLIQAQLRIYDMFGRSDVLIHAEQRCCLVACMCSDMV